MGKNRIEDVYNEKKEAVRLNKYMSEAGICSRREADRLIQEGKVYVNGKVALCGTKVTPADIVTIGKKQIQNKEKMVVLAVYKPTGIVCTEEKKVKQNIIRFLKYPQRITYAGRLDKDSEGLLIMTNNGDIIQQMMRAANYHEKEYIVKVEKEITDAFIEKMASGVRITDAEKGLDEVTRPCKIKRIGKYTFRIILTQGLNRQIRRMCSALGYEVKALKRVRIMNIELGNLRPGEYRKVTDQELNQLYEMLQGNGRGL